MNGQLAISFSSLTEVPPAKNQLAAVLKLLIESGGVSERDTVFNGFRSRISQLRKKLNIRTIQKDFTSQFGRRSQYNVHFILDCDKEEARKLYEKINK